MKVLLMLVLTLFSINSHAAKLWTELSVRDFVYLLRPLAIKNSTVEFEKSAKMTVLEVTPMPTINVYLYKVQATECLNPQAVSELEMYFLPQRRGKTTIGIELRKNCELEIYVEKTDLGTVSLFN